MVQKAKALSQAAAVIGDVQIRNRGTLGGALTHADPQGDYHGTILALDATLVARGPSGERTKAVEDFFTGLWETALNNGELLTEIQIPTDVMNTSSGYVKFTQPASQYHYVGCGVALSTNCGVCSDIRVGFSGVGEWAFRDSGTENTLKGQPLNDNTINAAADKVTKGKAVLSDYFVSEEYLRAMAKVFAKRAIRMFS